MIPWIIVILAVASIIGLLVTDAAKSAGTPATETVGRGNVRVTLPSVQTAVTKRRKSENRQSLRERLVLAGLYRDNFVNVLRVLRFVLLGLCCLGGYLLFETGMMSLGRGLFIGITTGLAATIVPVVLLDFLKSRRQTEMRRALPDALDVIVVCLDGGLSLTGAFSRVAQELSDVHPLLAMELRIAEREIQMGQSIGDAIRSLAGRFDLEELRTLAMVLSQADRFGASVSNGFKVFAHSMRLRRQQEAEEQAHKAAVKLVFPTALLIFPAMFIVTIGPAVFRAKEVLLPLLEKVNTQL
jgi:tight adherence protein C